MNKGFMATNLPQSRNRNLPPPPEEPADVRRRVMSPLPGPEPKEEKKAGVVRHLVAMLIVGGLVLGGILFYQRALEKDTVRQESLLQSLRRVGEQVWDSRGVLDLPAATETRRKELADLPRIFLAAHAAAQKAGIAPRIMAIEGDPPPGNNLTASHQINFYFDDRPLIVLRVQFDAKSESLSFIGVHNRIVPSREVLIEEGKAAELEKPVLPGDSVPSPPAEPPASAPVPPAPAPLAEPDAAPPVEKVSEAPANPR